MVVSQREPAGSCCPGRFKIKTTASGICSLVLLAATSLRQSHESISLQRYLPLVL